MCVCNVFCVVCLIREALGPSSATGGRWDDLKNPEKLDRGYKIRIRNGLEIYLFRSEIGIESNEKKKWILDSSLRIGFIRIDLWKE